MVGAVPSLFAATEIHVSPRGNDRAAGTLRSPLRTITAAISHALETPKGDSATIFMHGGRYNISNTIEIGEAWQGAHLAIKAYNGDEVSLSGGTSLPIKTARRVTRKSAIWDRLQSQCRDSIVEIDLTALGITPGDLHAAGFGRPSIPAWSELFVNDRPMSLSRWPNDSLSMIGKVLVPGTGENLKNGEYPVFTYNAERPAAWANAGEFWISGYFAHGYADDMIKVASIDTAARTIHTAQHTVYGFMGGAAWRQWFALNLPEEIDRPGEYVMDAKAGKIYLYPPVEPMTSLDISVLEEPMMAIENTSNITISGITFEHARGIGVYMEGTHNVQLAGCTIRNVGGVALCVGRGSESTPQEGYEPNAAEAGGSPKSRAVGDLLGKVYQDVVFNRNAGTNNGIKDSYIYNVGSGGVSLGGGDRTTLVPSGNYVENCRMHDYNRVEKSYRPAVWMDGVGNRITGCDIYNAPSMAILFHGNDHVIEYCSITNVCNMVDDQGAIYYGRDPSERGNIIRYCYFKELSPKHRVTATYHDDGACGSEVYGNIYYKAGSLPVLIGGGHDHHYKNNIFIESPVAIHIDNRMQGWGKNMVEPGDIVDQRLKVVRHTEPPYSTAYPELVNYWNENPAYPKRNTVDGNLFYKIGNLMSGQTQWGEFWNNWITNQDPGFVDPTDPLKGFKADAPIFEHIKDFPNLPFDKIGCKLPVIE